MGDMTLGQMAAELQRRITNLGTAEAEAALNRAVRWINRQGSYPWNMAAPVINVVPISGIFPIPATMDIGKAHVFLNPTGQPIRRVGVQEAWVSLNYNTPVDMGFDSYWFDTTNINFRPVQTGTTSVSMHYHIRSVTYTGGQQPNLPREFDDLVIDLAEAEERRIYDVGETWQLMLGRSQEQIRVLLDGYHSTVQQPMMASEAQQAIAERTQTGRT